MRLIKILSIVVGVMALSACAQQKMMTSEKESPIVMKDVTMMKQAIYSCGMKANKSLTVTYHFEGDRAIAAEVTYKDKAISQNKFNRVEDKDSARFVSPEKLVWVADENLKLSNFNQVDGNMLYQEGKNSDKIIVKYCGLNKEATAKLNK